MVDWNMLKCAFGKHEYGRMLHDDITNRWIKICRHCGTIIKVEGPKDSNGNHIDSHTWLRRENEATEDELSRLMTEFFDR